MNYQVREINSCESRILDKIDIIKRYGIDTNEYKKRLDIIINKLSTKKSETYLSGQAVQKMYNEALYNEVLGELRKLEIDLDNKQAYLTIHFKNSCFVQEERKCRDYDDPDKIVHVAEECKGLLRDVFNMESNNVEDVKKAIQEVYKTAYKVIKRELLTNCHSVLLDYIIETKMGIEFLNDLVREDIEELKKNGTYDRRIEEVINEISKAGINYNYADVELLLIMVLKDRDKVITRLKAKAKDFEDEINRLDRIDDDLYEMVDKNSDEYSKYSRKSKSNRIKALTSAILLSLSLLSYKFAPSIAKKSNTNATYTSKIEAYDTVSDSVKTEEFTIEKKGKGEVIVRIYDPVKSSGKRDYKTYHFNQTDLDNLEDYIELTDGHASTSSGSREYSILEQLSRDGYAVVERTTYSDGEVVFDEEGYNSEMKVLSEIILSMAGILGTSTAIFVIMSIINGKKKREADERLDYNKKRRKNYRERLIEYKNLKSELNRLISEAESRDISPEEYKKMVLK